jgi:outer membrane protein assembly factor BamB
MMVRRFVVLALVVLAWFGADGRVVRVVDAVDETRAAALAVRPAEFAAQGSSQQASAASWSQWRGARRDGHSAETGLLQDWPAAGPPLAWKATGAGIGYSSMSLGDGKLYTLGVVNDAETVLAYDVTTGARVWATPLGRRFRNEQGDGPRSTPTFENGRLYVLGANGDLACLDAKTGARQWGNNLFKTFGGSAPYWGLAESPLVLPDKLIVQPGGRGSAFAALNKSDGSTMWKSGTDEAGYSSAVTTQVGDRLQIVFFTASKTTGVDARDGRVLWSYPRASNGTANVATPIVRGDRVFVSSDYGTGAALLQLTPAGAANEVYFTRDMRNHHATSILVGDHVFGFSGSILTALHFDTGKLAWRDRSVGKGSLAYADGRLYAFSEDGVVGLLEASPAAYKEHGRFRLQTSGRGPTWSHPVVAGGKLFLRDHDTIYAYDVRARP